jgi:hypothetical protein
MSKKMDLSKVQGCAVEDWTDPFTECEVTELRRLLKEKTEQCDHFVFEVEMLHRALGEANAECERLMREVADLRMIITNSSDR